MWTSTFQPPAFRDDYLQLMLDCLVRMNLLYLQDNPGTPKLYAAGVRYEREPSGVERWASIPHVLALGYGDCEDLGCWLAAEKIRAGDRGAKAFPRGRETPHGRLVHIMVRTGDGRIEDPSRVLGMGKKKRERR